MLLILILSACSGNAFAGNSSSSTTIQDTQSAVESNDVSPGYTSAAETANKITDNYGSTHEE